MSDTDNKPADSKGGEPSVEALTAELAAKNEEITKLTKNRDTAFTSLRRVEAELETLKAESSNRDKQTATDKGDIEALRKSFQTDLEKAEAEKEKAIKRLNAVVVEKEILAIAARHAVDPSDVYALLKDEFELGEDDAGNPIPVCKKSALTPEKFILDFLEKKPHLAKNKRAPGADTQGKDSNGQGHSGVTLEQMEKMSPAEFAAAARKNPKLAEEYLKRNPR